MFSRAFALTLKVCALLVLPVLIAASVLLFGPAGFRPAPQSAEAAFLSEVKQLTASDAEGGDQLGYNVAVSAAIAVASARNEGVAPEQAGPAYVFQELLLTPTPTITSTATSTATPTTTPTATETPTYTPTATVDGRPNIVVIMTDDQDDMGSMSRMTKVMSLLAENGITFTNSFVDFPLCCPARASFLTGQAAHNHGIESNVPPDGGYEKFMPTEGNTLPVWMQQAGYTTAHIGKYLNGYGAGNVPPEHVPPGWSSWNGLPGNIEAHSYYNYIINTDGILQIYGDSPSDYQTDVLAQKASGFIASQQGSDQPFFLWLAPLAPHVGVDIPFTQLLSVPAPRHNGLFADLPLPQPPNYNEADVTDKPSFIRSLPLMDEDLIAYTETAYRKQAETLLAVDDMVETVINSLQNAGKLDNTIVIYTSDNGYSNGEHRRPAGKQFIYEESIRVPLIVRGPGIPKNQTRNQLVNNLDLVATILEYSQVTPGRTQDGQSLKNLLQSNDTPWRTALLVQGMNQFDFSDDSFSTYKAVRSENYVYAQHSLLGEIEEEFYALNSDPYQLTSLHNNPAYFTVMNNLRNVLDNLKSCSGETCWVTSDALSKPTPQPFPGDTDGDGCPDTRENGPDETLGGQRDYLNPWDFYDTNGDGEVDLFTDVLGVVQHYSLDGSPPYDVQFDRGPSAGPKPWNMTAPDGSIDLFTDILGVIRQFGHDCR